MSDFTPDYGRRVVVDLCFELALGAVSHAIREEGLHALARIDVRDHFMRQERHLFRQYEIVEAWSPDLAIAALTHSLDAGLVLPTRFVLYELADGETAVLASEPLAPLAAHADWRAAFPDLAVLADRESNRVARVLDRVQHESADATSTVAGP